MNWWSLLAVVIGALCGGVTYRLGHHRGFRAGEQVGAQAIATHFGVQLTVYKDEGPAKHYDELEEHSETGGVVRPLKDYGHGKR